MGLEGAYATLRAHFRGAWSSDPGSVLVFENEAGKPDADATEWAEFLVAEGDTFSPWASSEGRPERTLGRVIVRMFFKPGSGAGLFRRRLDRVAAIWRTFSSAGFYVRETRGQPVGVSQRYEGWAEYQAITPFEYDETPA